MPRSSSVCPHILISGRGVKGVDAKKLKVGDNIEAKRFGYASNGKIVLPRETKILDIS